MSVAQELIKASSILSEIAIKLEEEERVSRVNKPVVEERVYKVVPDEREWITRKEACRIMGFPTNATNRIAMFSKMGLIKEVDCFGYKLRRGEVYSLMERFENGELSIEDFK